MQRYFVMEKRNGFFVLSGDDEHHIKNVMRMRVSEEIEIVFENEVFLCEITQLEPSVHVTVVERYKEENNNLNVTLYIPLLKEQKMDLILQKATELGVSEIVPLILERSVVELSSEKFTKKKERWYKICKEASEQSKRSDIPKIGELTTIKELQNIEGEKIVCSTKKNVNSLKNYLKRFDNHVKMNIVIGPEGGITEKEESALNALGFESVSLGNRILRVETVPLMVLSILNYITME